MAEPKSKRAAAAQTTDTPPDPDGDTTPAPDVETPEAAQAAAAVPDGHRRVEWLYHRDKTLIGTVADLPAVEAAMWARQNRVRYVDPQTPLGPRPEPWATPAR